MDSRWNEWNTDHIAEKGISPDEAESVVLAANRPYPQKTEDDKWLVRGRGHGGRWLQIAYILDDDGTVFVIHARELTDGEKRRERRKHR